MTEFGELRDMLRAGLTGWYRAPEGVEVIESIEEAEKVADPAAYIKKLGDKLAPGGILLIGANNRLGLRYVCGDRDKYTGRSFDGIENYARTYAKKEDIFTGRMYDKAEWDTILHDAGIKKARFYAVFPGLEAPTHIFAEGYRPNESLKDRIFPWCTSPDTVFLEEGNLLDSYNDNGMLCSCADAWLIECSFDGTAEFSDALQVTSSLERGRERAYYTIISEDRVEKRAAFPEGRKSVEMLYESMTDLKIHGIQVVDFRLSTDGSSLIMPVIRDELYLNYLRRLACTDGQSFLKAADEYFNLICASSEPDEEKIYEGKNMAELGPVLKKGYVDMVPLNAFEKDGKPVFFDQEICMDGFPAKAIMLRVAIIIYDTATERKALVSRNEFYEHFGLTEYFDFLNELSYKALDNLRNDRKLFRYHNLVRPDGNIINANRQKINFSMADYQRLFIDIFDGTEEKEIVLFGSGRYAKQYLALYGHEHPAAYAVDNNRSRYGQKIEDIEVRPVEMLGGLEPGSYKVFICIKSYLSVMHQLENMGVKNFCVFDPSIPHQLKRRPTEDPVLAPGTKKKYHIGYIAGVFDLFHVGHLNMFRKAKELCDYLIVGVVSDEGVTRFKKTQTFVPFEERIEMVRSCKYVDEAEKIPYLFGGSEDAWRMYHFDVQFSGSDYIDDPVWLSVKDFLEKHGSTLYFFPYTKSTSSTKIKALIDKKLL